MVRRAQLVALVCAGLAVACARRASPDDPEFPPVAAIDAAPPATIVQARPTDPEVVAGAALWGKYCALCHGAQAQGYVADNAPSLVTATFLATASDDFLRAGIGRGRPGTAMAGYSAQVGGPLDDAQIAQVIAFIRGGAPAPTALPAVAVTGDAARGAVIYRAACVSCHGTQDVRGEAVHLANAVFLATASDAFLRHAIVHGRLPTKMVAFGGALPDADIDAVVAYVRSFARPPVAAPALPVKPAPTTAVINPRGRPPSFTLREGRFVSAVQVKRALDQGRRLVLADARPASEWIRGHIPGAVPVPHYDTDAIDALPADGTWIIAYCACPHHASGIVIDELRQRGRKNVAVLDEGVLVWQRMGFPVIGADGKPAPMPPAHDHSHHGHDHTGHRHGPAPPRRPAPNSSPLQVP